ncbi:MAG: DUF1836 domain-containing protein [Erysipelotrichaceae bacterium]|nr:DUF1836 domain-containing protein [Erysipelotrichaceae bacterium]
MLEISKEKRNAMETFRLPTYKEIPSVGLYLDQTSKYINECLSVIPGCSITNSMISNYVKHKLIAHPVKKQYGRDQIAYLIFIALTKCVLSLEDVARLFSIQKQVSTCEEAYECFARFFEEDLQRMSEGKEIPPVKEKNKEKALLKTLITTIIQRIYLNELLSDL